MIILKRYISLFLIILSIIFSCSITQSKNVFAYNDITDYLFYDNQFYIFNSNNNITKIFPSDKPNTPILSVNGNGIGAYVCDNTIFCIVSTGIEENIIYTYNLNNHKQTMVTITDLYIDYDNLYNFAPINSYTFAYVKNNSYEVIIYDINKKSSYNIEINNGINSIAPNGDVLLVKENTRLYYIDLKTSTYTKYNNFSASGKVKNLSSDICIIGNNIYSYDSDSIELITTVDDNTILLDGGYAFFKDNIIYIADENYCIIEALKIDFNICSISYNDLLYVLTSDNKNYYKNSFDIYDLINKNTYKPIENPDYSNSNSETNEYSQISNSSHNNSTISQNPVINTDNNIFIDTKYFISGNYITIPQGTTIATIKKSINTNYILSVINHNDKSITSGKVGTGFTLTITNKYNNKKYTYHTIIYGDVTGEGNINSNDINTLIYYLLGENDLSSYAKISADIDKNGIINNKDLLIISQKTK